MAAKSDTHTERDLETETVIKRLWLLAGNINHMTVEIFRQVKYRAL